MLPETEGQLCLFDLGVDVSRLREEVAQMRRSKRSVNTVKAYAAGWARFESWCRAVGRRSLPASSETASLFVAWCYGEGLRSGTVQLALSSINDRHRAEGQPLPVGPEVRAVLTGARRLRRERRQCKAALTVDELRRVVLELDPSTAQGCRDRALLLVGFAGGFRRSELVSLDVSDVSFEAEGVRVVLRGSKTDRVARGREVGIHSGHRRETDPVRALRAWCKMRGDEAGPLFCSVGGGAIRVSRRVGGGVVAAAVKRGIVAIGGNPAVYGAHSLRAGCVTASVAAGADALAIMARTGHRSIETVQRYVRPASVFAVDPLAKAL